MLYESRCVPISLWADLKDFYIKEGGWEAFFQSNESVVYLRKHISGNLNDQPGWSKVE